LERKENKGGGHFFLQIHPPSDWKKGRYREKRTANFLQGVELCVKGVGAARQREEEEKRGSQILIKRGRRAEKGEKKKAFLPAKGGGGEKIKMRNVLTPGELPQRKGCGGKGSWREVSEEGTGGAKRSLP